MNARNRLILAIDEVPTATPFAVPAMASQITDAYSLSFFPALHPRPNGFDFPDHFVAGNAGKSESWKTTFDCQSIGVANATSLDMDSDLPKGRLNNRSLNDFQLARFRYLHCFISPAHKKIYFCFLFFALHTTDILQMVLNISLTLIGDCRDAFLASR